MSLTKPLNIILQSNDELIILLFQAKGRRKSPNLVAVYLCSNWFSVMLVLRTKNWVSAIALGPSLLGHVASRQWHWCWQARCAELKVITPGIMTWFAPLLMRSSFTKAGTNVASLLETTAWFKHHCHPTVA